MISLATIHVLVNPVETVGPVHYSCMLLFYYAEMEDNFTLGRNIQVDLGKGSCKDQKWVDLAEDRARMCVCVFCT
jgi:hypothetical protein